MNVDGGLNKNKPIIDEHRSIWQHPCFFFFFFFFIYVGGWGLWICDSNNHLTHKASITTAADEKFYDIFPNFRKKYGIS